jgi:hypothetical protein
MTLNPQTSLQGRIFRARMLRDKIGPDDPTYHLLMLECKRDVFSVFDDFLTVIDNSGQTEIMWTPGNEGNAARDPTALTSTGDVNGVIELDSGDADNGTSRMRSQEIFTADHRPVALFRAQIFSSITTTKFELGFTGTALGDNGENSGAVLVKDTPTSTATDYACIVYDTDDDTSVDLHADGGDTTVASVASSPVFTGTDSTFVTNTWYDFMLAVNEANECRFWVDSTFRGVIRGTSPDIDLEPLGVYAFVQSRGTDNDKTMYLDYILAWQERVRLPRAVN